MHIPIHWMRATKEVEHPDGRQLHLVAWGWSSTDRSEAKAKAEERLASLESRVLSGADLPGHYGYGSRPLREEIIHEIKTDGKLTGIVTRNSYGSLILNTSEAMFVDVDLAPNQTGSSANQGLLGRMFGGKDKGGDAGAQKLIAIKDSLLRAAPSDANFRLYRTAAGFRILATDRTYEPGSSETEKLMRAVGVDPSFLTLCRAQRSFRARLTPKPWRCGHRLPPGQFPREDESSRQEFVSWNYEYEEACSQKATCKFLEEIGSAKVHDAVEPILSYHDRFTRAEEQYELA